MKMDVKDCLHNNIICVAYILQNMLESIEKQCLKLELNLMTALEKK